MFLSIHPSNHLSVLQSDRHLVSVIFTVFSLSDFWKIDTMYDVLLTSCFINHLRIEVKREKNNEMEFIPYVVMCLTVHSINFLCSWSSFSYKSSMSILFNSYFPVCCSSKVFVVIWENFYRNKNWIKLNESVVELVDQPANQSAVPNMFALFSDWQLWCGAIWRYGLCPGSCRETYCSSFCPFTEGKSNQKHTYGIFASSLSFQKKAHQHYLENK